MADIRRKWRICKKCGDFFIGDESCHTCGSSNYYEMTDEEDKLYDEAVSEGWHIFYTKDLWRKYVFHSGEFSPEEHRKLQRCFNQIAQPFEERERRNQERHTPIYNEDGSLNIEATRKSSPQKVSAIASIHLPKCPTCGSTNVHKMTLGDKAGSILMLGIFSRKIGKQFKCDNCGYEW